MKERKMKKLVVGTVMGAVCKRQVLFHKFWQLFFHNYRHFIFHIFYLPRISPWKFVYCNSSSSLFKKDFRFSNR